MRKGEGKKPRKLGVAKGSRRKREGLVQFVVVRGQTQLPAQWVPLVYPALLPTSVHSREQILSALAPSNVFNELKFHKKSPEIASISIATGMSDKRKNSSPISAASLALSFPTPGSGSSSTEQCEWSVLGTADASRTGWNCIFWEPWSGNGKFKRTQDLHCEILYAKKREIMKP